MDSNSIQNIKNRYGIVGNSDGLNRALDVATQVAPTDLSVLIIGESGVGKEIIPRIIHDNSARKHNKYMAINCGSIPEGTIDSELFGHAKGAFTGAYGEREGYFATADKGTLFLDEVGELPLPTQARLLRVLETGEYIRVGESEVRKTDVRIVAATNVNMQAAIREGRFREDLYYRLNTIPINLPPLRERGTDIEMLFRMFARSFSDKYGREPIRLTPDARDLLLAYKWPGNIRQLKNLTEQISILYRERDITSDILKEYISDDSGTPLSLVPRGHQGSHEGHDSERELIITLMQSLAALQNEVKELKTFVNSKLGSVHSTQVPQPHLISNNVISHDNASDDFKISTIDHGMVIHDQNESTPIIDIVPEPEQYNDTPLTMKALEKIKINEALERNNHNRVKAAKELGISVRTLYRKINGQDNSK